MFRFKYTLPTGRAHTAFRSFHTTYFPLAVAMLLAVPQLLTGQCTTMICNQNVPFSLGNNCTGSINPTYIIQNNWTCQGPMTMTYYDAWGTNLGNTLTSAQLGQTVSVHVKHNWSNNFCWGSVYVVDGKKPLISTTNLTLNCTEDYNAAALDPPLVSDNCSPTNQISLTHQDTTLDFGCGYTGFSGYFDPNNWNVCLTPTGDGGVDVSGAPNSVLVEGANSSPMSTTPSYVTKFKIVIPTEGYVSFDWSSFGGSSFSNEGFYLTINNWCIRLSNDTTQSGTYTTPLLQPGDVLSFEQTSNGALDANSTIISNFHFSTLAWKVIQRTWTATDAWGNTATKLQTITLNRATLGQVQFPPNLDGVAAPMLPCGLASSDPSATGFPFVDEDGNPTTTADQFDVQNGDCFFNLTYSDQSIPTCDGSEVILRKWTVLDWCTSNFVEHTQIIKRFDVTPPSIACPPPVTLGVDDFDCFGTINLPSASATDDCSATVTITPQWAFGNGFGPFGNVPQGTHSVSYLATDACGNTASCSTLVTVVDDVAPTVICQGFTVASLSSMGTATVFATDLDAGSYDHCCIQGFALKRTSDPASSFGNSVTVTCADIGPVPVTLRVTDCNGNANTCDVTVNVHDEIPPLLTPPADVVVDCNTDLSNPAAFGNATVTDNCTFTLAEALVPNVTSCGQGTVTRTFIATDASGNVSTAQQVIHLVNQSPWNSTGNQIIWPTDYTSQACSGESLEPYDLPYPYNGPTLLGQNGCESVAVSFDDEIFMISEPACYKILRTWTILDWCVYQPNSNSTAGMWTHTQLIEVVDNQSPVFANTPTVINGTGGAGCTGNVILPLPSVNDCSNHVTITASGALGSGFSFQNVPAGSYPMTYFANDGCGNTAEHHFTVLVGDSGAPTANCASGVVVTLNAQGQGNLTAQQLNLGSFDDCAPASSLQFSFSPSTSDAVRLFTCADVGPNVVQLWVTDPGGNSDFCEATVTVLSNPTACAGGVTLGGMIQTPFGQPVGQVTVGISGSATLPSATTQAGVGSYAFQGLPFGGDYTVTPSKNIGQGNGVTSFDLAKINEHILGVVPFTQAWQLIAADANNTGSITAADLVAIQAVILGTSPNFQNGTPSWRFVPTSHTFADPLQPWPFPQEASLNDLAQDDLDVHFTGIKIGDVSGNANPAFVVGSSAGHSWQSVPEGRSGGAFSLNTTDKLLRKGEWTEVRFAMDDAAAWQFTLEFDPQQIEIQPIVEEKQGQPVFNATLLPSGQLPMLAFGKTPVTGISLRVRALMEDMRLADVLRLGEGPTQAAAWSRDEEQMKVLLHFAEGTATPSLLGCTPNPMGRQGLLWFELPAAGEARFIFTDATGRVLHRAGGQFDEGRNSLPLNREQFPATTGLVLVRMEAAGSVLVTKIMLAAN